MIYPVSLADCLSREGADIIVSLSRSQQAMLLKLSTSLQDSPDLILSDYADYSLDDIDLFNDLLLNQLMDTALLNVVYPKRVIIRPDEYETISGTALTWVADTGQRWGGVFHQTTPAINDKYFFINIQLRKGNYHWRLLTQKSNSAGIVTLAINNVNKTTIDLYNSTTLKDQLLTGADFTVSSNDNLIELRMLTKNASSSNYDFRWNMLDLEWEND